MTVTYEQVNGDVQGTSRRSDQVVGLTGADREPADEAGDLAFQLREVVRSLELVLVAVTASTASTGTGVGVGGGVRRSLRVPARCGAGHLDREAAT